MAGPHVLIAGAGIGGLTAALALLKAGVDVDVYERAPELGEVGAGLHVSPNGSRVLFALGLREPLERAAARPKERVIRLWNTGEGWNLPGQDEGASERYGSPYLLLHRADLHAALVDAVHAAKRDAIHVACSVTDFEDEGSAIRARLADGREVRGNVLVGADGIRSTIRHKLLGPDRPRFTGAIYWRGLVPIERVPIRARTSSAGWMGPNNYITIYPVRAGTLLNFNGSAPRSDWQTESWTERGAKSEIEADYAGWHDEVQAIIRNIDIPYKWGSFLRDPLPQWTRGCVTLLGDACHPMLASLGQGANMAIEDGLMLARALGTDRADLAAALQRYEAVRRPRTTQVVAHSNAQDSRRLRPQLADPIAARQYMDELWAPKKVYDWYDWIFGYDAVTAAV
jgi:salicylate hydroxylase